MKIIANNKKAFFNYEVIEEYIAGIVLEGNEIKSIRKNGSMSISESFCIINNGEIFLHGSNIAVYNNSSPFNTNDATRDRKLLLNKKEINKLKKNVEQKGFTIVPLSVFFNERGLLKVKIALCKGKHDYDKRQSIKERDIKRFESREN